MWGYAGSHGCLGLTYQDSAWLWEWAHVGTPVVIIVTGQTGGSAAVSTTLSGTTASTSATAAVTIPSNRPSVVSALATFTLAIAADAPPDVIHVSTASGLPR